MQFNAHSRKPAVIAHRGASAYAPENTLAAFRLAIGMGADWFECDCQPALHGEAMVIHDSALERTTNGKGAVNAHTCTQLKALDAGSWKDAAFTNEAIPTLAETLAVAKGRIGVYIEIKDQGGDEMLVERISQYAREAITPREARARIRQILASSTSANAEFTSRIIEEVRARGMGQDVVLQSFSLAACATALRLVPEWRIELLGVGEHPQEWADFMQAGESLGVAGFNCHHGSLTPERIAWIHEHGKSVAAWTVDLEDDMSRLADWGVDALITNRPDVCKRLLGL